MSYYRKYRPQVISEVDNQSVRERLLSLLTKDKSQLPHAFLFIGPKGTGKTTAARIVAKIFNCEKLTKTHGPCGKCEQCRSIAENTNLDVLEIDAASNRGIDEIRTLRERISLAPSAASYKVYIIDEVHMLTSEAFNALLKTLEEPPPHAVFVLATTDPQKIPATIKSRCTVVHFTRANSEELLSALRRIARAEKMEVDKETLEVVTECADGSFRDAVKLLEQLSFHKGKITAEVARSLLAVSEEKTVTDFLMLLLTHKAPPALGLVEKLVAGGNDLKAFVTACLTYLENELVATVSGEKVSAWTVGDLTSLIRRLAAAFVEMKSTAIAQLPLELAVVEFCKTGVSAVVKEEETQTRSVAAGTGEKTASGIEGDLLSLDKLIEHWRDFIEELKPFNHSIAGVLRSSRPKAVGDGIVTIEAFYKFHQERLSEPKIRDALAAALKKLFGAKVKVEIVLGKK